MRKVVYFLFMVVFIIGCGKDTSWGEPENVEPYVGAFSNSDQDSYSSLLYGHLEVFDISAKDTVMYGVKLVMNNKAYSYKLEYAKVIKYVEAGGKGFYIPLNDEVNWIGLDSGSERENVSKGMGVEYKMELPKLSKGVYKVRMTTECDGETESDSYVFIINDLTSIIPIQGNF